MRKKILILSGNGKPSISAANIYKELLGDAFNLIIVEEHTSSTKIISFLKKKMKTLGLFFVIDFAFLRLYQLFFVNSKDIKKLYSPDLITKNINSTHVRRLLSEGEYEYIISNACSILSAATIKCSPKKIINLHNGVNPRYRGTGNFWALYEKCFNLIGVTIHFIDKGVDTGEIISILPDDGSILGNSFSDIDIHAFEIGAKEIAGIIIGNTPSGIVKKYEQLESKCYSYPGLTHYLKAKKNFKNHKSMI